MKSRPQTTAALLRSLAVALSLSALLACGEKPPPLPKLGADDVVLAFGDSLTFGTGAGTQEAYPTVLSKLISRQVVGAGGPPEFYDRIAKEFSLPLEKNVLNDVLFDRSLKSDPIHPNATGYRRLSEAIAELLRQSGAV